MLRRASVDVGALAALPPLRPCAVKVSEISGGKVGADKVIALSRLVIDPEEPQNAATILIGAFLRTLRREGRWQAVVTFADLSEGHTGAVYRAANATFAGVTAPEPYWVDPSTGRRVSRKSTKSRTARTMSELGLERRVSPGKLRFIWWLT